jgi:hypothetical protein
MVNKLPVVQMQQVSGVNVYVTVVDVDCGGKEKTSPDGERRGKLIYLSSGEINIRVPSKPSVAGTVQLREVETKQQAWKWVTPSIAERSKECIGT